MALEDAWCVLKSKGYEETYVCSNETYDYYVINESGGPSLMGPGPRKEDENYVVHRFAREGQEENASGLASHTGLRADSSEEAVDLARVECDTDSNPQMMGYDE
jgi:hypothetical protein